MPQLLIGTSGWVYKHWKEVFYPSKLPANQQLPFYAERFPTVELNFSFYRLPTRRAFEDWRTRTPSGFVFAVKGSRYLTHIRRLKEPEEPLERFMQNACGLAEKLGPILFQFPPNWKIDQERIDDFLRALRGYRKQRFAFEFRHKSWLAPELYQLLERYKAALCLPVSPTAALDVQLTTDWTYVRMHRGRRGTGYSGQELSAWARRIGSFLDKGVDTYVYFNNDPEGHAIRDAERLRKILS
jgi:uncharacterized protein YecE (DUF72 family)